MALIAWLVVWELTLAYGLAFLPSPVDVAFLLAVLLLSLGAGWYGLLGLYWQSVAWFVGVAWYVRGFARYLADVDPALAAAPEPFAALIIMLYIPILPPAWMVSIVSTEARHWFRHWRDEE